MQPQWLYCITEGRKSSWKESEMIGTSNDLIDNLLKIISGDRHVIGDQIDICLGLFEDHYKEQNCEFSGKIRRVVRKLISQKVKLYEKRVERIHLKRLQNATSRKEAFDANHILLKLDMISINTDIFDYFSEQSETKQT